MITVLIKNIPRSAGFLRFSIARPICPCGSMANPIWDSHYMRHQCISSRCSSKTSHGRLDFYVCRPQGKFVLAGRWPCRPGVPTKRATGVFRHSTHSDIPQSAHQFKFWQALADSCRRSSGNKTFECVILSNIRTRRMLPVSLDRLAPEAKLCERHEPNALHANPDHPASHC